MCPGALHLASQKNRGIMRRHTRSALSLSWIALLAFQAFNAVFIILEAIPSSPFWSSLLLDRSSMAVVCELLQIEPKNAVRAHCVYSGCQAALEDMRGAHKPQRMALRPQDGVQGRDSNDQLIDVK